MTERRPHLDLFALCALVGCAALWGLNQVATKQALQEIPPLLQAGLRSLGASALLLLWVVVKRLDLAPGQGHWQSTWRGGVLAGSLFAAEFACIFLGLQFTSASRMVVFIYLAPLIVAAAIPLIAPGERLSARQLLGLAGAFSGLIWAFAEGLHAPAVGDQQWLGDLLGLCGAVLWAGTTLTIRGSRLATALPEQTLLYQLVISGVVLTATGWMRGEVLPTQLSTLAWVSMGFQTIIVTFASYLVWFWLVRHYMAATISAFTLLTPIFGLLFGVWLLHEPLTDRLLVALLAVAGGIGFVSWPRSRPTPR